MKPAWIVLAFLFCLLPATAEAQQKIKPDLVFLLIGEDNMAGRAPMDRDLSDAKPLDNVFLLNDQGEWEVAVHPLNRHSNIAQKNEVPQYGLGTGFARRLQRSYPDVTIGLIVNARGRTGIDTWKPRNDVYKATLRRVIELPRGQHLSGILWHHGESNLQDPMYLEKLLKLVEAFRSDLDDPGLPFIAGELYGPKPLNSFIQRLPNHTEWTGVVSAEKLTSSDLRHFDHDSLDTLGERYAQKWIGSAGRAHKP